MKEKHIIDMLENSPLASLSESEVETIRAHTGSCEACRGAYEAAQISTLIIKERAAETIEPDPFFQTRVLAALREQQATSNVPVFSRLWKSAGVLVSSMALTTAALAAFSFFTPNTGSQEATATLTPYSAEAVVFNQDQIDDMTDEQILNTIYADEGEAK
jgi:predicted anti-sigma-YlaC factor YlaD